LRDAESEDCQHTKCNQDGTTNEASHQLECLSARFGELNKASANISLAGAFLRSIEHCPRHHSVSERERTCCEPHKSP